MNPAYVGGRDARGPSRNVDLHSEKKFQTDLREKIAVSFWKSNRYTLPMSEQTCEPVELPTVDNDLLDPYEKLVEIEILGKQVEVPEKNRLLRCFQFLSLNTIS
jgi:hypothetical protein